MNIKLKSHFHLSFGSVHLWLLFLPFDESFGRRENLPLPSLSQPNSHLASPFTVRTIIKRYEMQILDAILVSSPNARSGKPRAAICLDIEKGASGATGRQCNVCLSSLLVRLLGLFDDCCRRFEQHRFEMVFDPEVVDVLGTVDEWAAS
jgi:hypothetical protein